MALAVDSHAGQISDRDNPGGFAHIPALDGIRGLAILLVLFNHLFWADYPTGNRILDFISLVRQASYAGVNLFFALSGFLITGILLDSVESPRFFSTFYARRSLRIFPLYYGFLIFLFCLTPLLHFTWSIWPVYYLTYTANLVAPFHGGPLNLGRFNINHFWSLQVEEQFYWIWPLILYRFRDLRSVVRISLLGCAVALGVRIVCVFLKGHAGFSDPYLTYSFTPSCADNILYGCCLAALVRSAKRERVLRLAPYVFWGAMAALCVIGAVNHGLDWNRPSTGFLVATIGFSLIGIASSSAIALALKSGSRTRHFFQGDFLGFMGKYSYGIYVYHYSISDAVMGPMRNFLDTQLHMKAVGVLLAALVAGALSVGVAWTSYRFFEAPFLRLKRFFSYTKTA
jgi:peptidoglycan/LPS O-acetylase OafA/YrhL